MSKFLTAVNKMPRQMFQDYVRSLANRSMTPLYRDKYAWKDPVFEMCKVCTLFRFVDGTTWYEGLKEAMDFVSLAMLHEVEDKPFPMVKINGDCENCESIQTGGGIKK